MVEKKKKTLIKRISQTIYRYATREDCKAGYNLIDLPNTNFKAVKERHVYELWEIGIGGYE